jgi:hypothetical protein
MPADRVLVSVVGWFPDHTSLEAVLGDWQQHMAGPNGIEWVASELRSHEVPTAPPA